MTGHYAKLAVQRANEARNVPENSLLLRLVDLESATALTMEAYRKGERSDDIWAALDAIGHACRRPPLAQNQNARGDGWTAEAINSAIVPNAQWGGKSND